jgi:hypothetical protein
MRENGVFLIKEIEKGQFPDTLVGERKSPLIL